MAGYAYYNGSFGRREEIRIPLSDRAIFFGDAVYDVAIGFGGKIHQGEEHLRRLINNADALSFNSPYTQDALEELALEVIARSGYGAYTVYIQLSRDSEQRVHSPVGCRRVNLLITVDELAGNAFGGEVRLISLEDKRYRYCNIKTTNLLPAVTYSALADKAECEEAVLHRSGIVTECAHSNISILKDGVLYTHPECELILPGITRRHLLLGARRLGIEYREVPFSLSELYGCDECIVTSTTRLCRRGVRLDGVKIGGRDADNYARLSGFLLEEINS